jgi:hypothetical protein
MPVHPVFRRSGGRYCWWRGDRTLGIGAFVKRTPPGWLTVAVIAAGLVALGIVLVRQ